MVRRLVVLTAFAFLAAAAPAAANIHILTGAGELASTNAATSHHFLRASASVKCCWTPR